VNGDGFDDFVVGAPECDEGAVYLFLGADPLPWGKNEPLSVADASFLGEYDGDLAGGSLAMAGDVNQDGLGDLLIGADFNEDGGDRAGKAYLVLGRTLANWGQGYSLSQADASFVGPHTKAYAGRSVAGAVDLSGDGVHDILIGATGADASSVLTHTGCVYLVHGRRTGWVRDVDLRTATDGSSLQLYAGLHVDGSFGAAVAQLGDVSGDGQADILIGEPYYDTGQTHLILGQGEARESLQLEKSGSDSVAPGGVLTYSIRYANEGTRRVRSVIVQDLLPVGAGYIGSTGGITRSRVGRLVVWQLGALAPGDTGFVRLAVTAPSMPGSLLSNCAWITSPHASQGASSCMTTTVFMVTRTETPTPTCTPTKTPQPSSTPCAPSLLAPPEGAVLDNGRVDHLDGLVWDFDWTDCPQATEYGIYVKSERALGPLLDLSDLLESSYHYQPSSGLVTDDYLEGWSWKVRARVGTEWGPWSQVRNFDVEPLDTDPPQSTVTATATTTGTPTRTPSATPSATGQPTDGPSLTATLTLSVACRLFLPIVLKTVWAEA
jgi:uncharacterized repeat protein (TIGR01451 family)